MKLVSIVVDALPDSCCMCPLMGKNEDLGYCITGEELEPSYTFRRPNWCPLVVYKRRVEAKSEKVYKMW